MENINGKKSSTIIVVYGNHPNMGICQNPVALLFTSTFGMANGSPYQRWHS